MLDENLIIYEYERLLLGERRKISFMSASDSERLRQGAIIIRWAIENILHWTPEQALVYLNNDIENRLMFRDPDGSRCIYKLMGIEYTRNNYFNRKSVLALAFPESIHYSVEEDAILEYKRKMRLEEFEHDKSTPKFHKNFFLGAHGSERLSAVLNYAISVYLGNMSPFELYRFFSNRIEARKWLTQHGLDDIPGFDTPLELLHYSLRGDDVNFLLYANEHIRIKCLDAVAEREEKERTEREKAEKERAQSEQAQPEQAQPDTVQPESEQPKPEQTQSKQTDQAG